MTKRLLTGVIGSPIEHSLSPLIHNHWLATHRLPGVYAPYHVAPERLDAFLALAPELGFRGLNVTIPLKTLVFDRLERRTDRAERAQSVNTLHFRDDGAVIGDSTDGYGFIANVLEGADLPSLEGLTVAMIGAGGAARAVVAALVAAGVASIRIANRTRANAEIIAEAFPDHVDIVDWPLTPAFFEDADVIVNGTSLGLSGEDKHRWSIPPLKPGAVATDMVYAPLDTPFLQAARAAGAKTVDGLGMLLHQARPGFERWHGIDPTVTPALRRLVLETRGRLP